MKKILIPLLTVVLLFCVMIMNAENGIGSKSSIPYKSPNSVLYGTDIIINNVPSQNQRNVHVSVAFNGWIYAVYTHNTSTNEGFAILKSTDNGNTWTLLQDYTYAGNVYTAAAIVAAGSDLAHLKYFVAGIVETPSTSTYTVWCDRWNGQTDTFENEFFNEQSSNSIYDLAIASDYRYPASGISPYSLGIVFSKYGSPQDSVILVTSTDGGYTIGSRNVVGATGNYFRKVAISFGISNTKWDGRYFVAWEEMDSYTSTMGHIWTGYTDPWIYSSIVNKVKLDSMYTSYYNACYNPSISTQFNNVDNSSGNLSEIVLFDGNWNAGDNDVLGMYNLQAAGTGIANWQQFVIADSFDDEMESDINFDPTFNNFLVTYFDSTTQKLPYIVNGMDLVDPGTWTVISDGYNDNSNLAYPYPKVQIDPIYTKVANVWNAEGSGGGVAMFDAEYYNNTGISQIHQSDVATLEGAYPNPAATKTSIGFTLNKKAEVIITLYSTYGQEIKLITDQSFNPGKNTVDVDVSTLPEGTYIYSFKVEDFTASGRIIVVR
jgi:hypothetical protein